MSQVSGATLAVGYAAWLRNTCQQRLQHLRVDRFDQMVIESGLRASSAIILLTEAGGRDQEQRPNWPSGTKAPGDLEAVQLGQLEVKEDDLGLHRAGYLQGRVSIVRHADLLILKPEELGERVGRIDVVVDHENAASN